MWKIHDILNTFLFPAEYMCIIFEILESVGIKKIFKATSAEKFRIANLPHQDYLIFF